MSMVFDFANNILRECYHDIQNRAEYDGQGHLIALKLSLLELSQLPPEISYLTNLQELDLAGNRLTQLPVELGQLTNLQELGLSDNQLTLLPAELGQLTNLQKLDLTGNRLTQLPVELGQLTNLQSLNLDNNQLTRLPIELGRLQSLRPDDNNQLTLLLIITRRGLTVSGNLDLLTPPPEIVAQRTEAMLRFLQGLEKDHVVRYEAKVLVVGEAETGKSSLIRTLRHEPFIPDLPTTYGIEVGMLRIPHPRQADTEITLNTWDFGGQHIYHATHQFFLTKRSLYLLVWSARSEGEQGRLDFWLETIHVQAPEAPVLLVATHADERTPDLNFERYKVAFPQIVGHFSVSNKG